MTDIDTASIRATVGRAVFADDRMVLALCAALDEAREATLEWAGCCGNADAETDIATLRAEMAEAAVMRIRDYYGLSDQSGCWIERATASPDDECIACVIAAIIDRNHHA